MAASSSHRFTHAPLPHPRGYCLDASPAHFTFLSIFLLDFLFLHFWSSFFFLLSSLSAPSLAASAPHLFHLLNNCSVVVP